MSVPSPSAFELGSERDRVFFERNPQRSHRVRAALADEMPEIQPPPDAWVMIAVKQIAPGIRCRAPFVSNTYVPMNEEQAREIYAALTRGSVAAATGEAIGAQLARRDRGA